MLWRQQCSACTMTYQRYQEPIPRHALGQCRLSCWCHPPVQIGGLGRRQIPHLEPGKKTQFFSLKACPIFWTVIGSCGQGVRLTVGNVGPLAINYLDSNVNWSNVGPTSVLSSRRWADVGPTYIAIWVGPILRGVPTYKPIESSRF